MGRVQTFEINSFFSLIPEVARLVAKIKKGDSINFDQIPALVTLTGFKPVTAGAEIQCAIQLRHRAKTFRVLSRMQVKINSYLGNSNKNN